MNEPTEFLVRCIENKKNYWMDIENGQQFEKCNVPWKIAQHGLCKTLNRKVLKKTINDSFEPLVFMATTDPKLPKKGMTFPYKNEDGKRSTWIFTPYEIKEAIEGLNEDLNDRELCIMLFAPRDVTKKLRYKLTDKLIEKIMKEIGGDVENGKRPKVGTTTISRTAYVETISDISQRKPDSYQRTF